MAALPRRAVARPSPYQSSLIIHLVIHRIFFLFFLGSGLNSSCGFLYTRPDSGTPGTERNIHPRGAITATLLAIGVISLGRLGHSWQRT